MAHAEGLAGGNDFDDALLVGREMHRRTAMARIGHRLPVARWPPWEKRIQACAVHGRRSLGGSTGCAP
jgi:hypothetical protein